MKRIRNFLKELFAPRARTVFLANIAEGTHDMTARITYEADAAIAERFLLVKQGSHPTGFWICDLFGRGLVYRRSTGMGFCEDESDRRGEYGAVDGERSLDGV